MAAVAEGLVARGAAPAEGDARVLADGRTVDVDDANAPPQEQRTVRARLDDRVVGRLLLRAAVDASKVQRAGGAGEDRLCNALGVGRVDADPFRDA
jgi:hypothetical protein